MKRLFDIIASAVGLVLVSPLLFAAACAIKCSSRGPAFFRQQRVGRNFQPFVMYKLRTMRDSANQGALITAEGDRRITKVGAVLRRWKIDELPQLLNVLKGDMSVVGPRPEVPSYVGMFHDDFTEILRVRPGITDTASIRYAREGEILRASPDPDTTYVTAILPDKIRLAKEYVRQATMQRDLELIFKTVIRIAN
jgi:lipopolysaccharide/colanic/teichoic acid biosynthesis glycosyltransferase